MQVSRYKNVWGVMSVACIGIALFLLPTQSRAELTSTSFTIESPTIGSVGGTNMSSTNYSLTPRSGNTYVTSGTDPIDDDEDEDDDSNAQGSGTKVKKKPNIQPIISATVNTDQFTDSTNQQGKNASARYNPQPIVKVENNVQKQSESENTIVSDAQDTDSDAERNTLLASLISGDFEKVANALGDTYSSLFSRFTARVIFFIWVMALLYFIRVNTAIGRKYSPF